MHPSWYRISICILHSCDHLKGRSIFTYYWAWTNRIFFALQPPICSQLRISTFSTNSKDVPKMPHWPVSFIILGYKLILPPLFGGGHCSLVGYFYLWWISQHDHHSLWVFWLLLHLQLSISHLLLVLLTIITRRWFWRFIYKNCRRAFISPTWTHLQIVSNARVILYEYHVSTFMIFLVCKHINL